jgi:hypothetical protein
LIIHRALRICIALESLDLLLSHFGGDVGIGKLLRAKASE